MIKVTYQRTLADFVSFNIYHIWKSPERKYFRFLIYFGVPLIVSLLVFVSTMFAGIPVTFSNYKGILVAFAVLVLLMYLLGGRLITKTIQKKIASGLTPEALNHLTSEAEITLTNKEIRMATPNHLLIKPWTEILKLRIAKGYYFVYTEPLQAIVIPWHAFKNGEEKAAFEQLLTKNLRLK